MATLIRTNGEIEEDFIASSLKDKQEAIGGYAQFVTIKPNKTMVINEDGWYLNLEVNQKASDIYGDTVVGDVILYDKNELLADDYADY